MFPKVDRREVDGEARVPAGGLEIAYMSKEGLAS